MICWRALQLVSLWRSLFDGGVLETECNGLAARFLGSAISWDGHFNEHAEDNAVFASLVDSTSSLPSISLSLPSEPLPSPSDYEQYRFYIYRRLDPFPVLDECRRGPLRTPTDRLLLLHPLHAADSCVDALVQDRAGYSQLARGPILWLVWAYGRSTSILVLGYLVWSMLMSGL